MNLLRMIMLFMLWTVVVIFVPGAASLYCQTATDAALDKRSDLRNPIISAQELPQDKLKLSPNRWYAEVEAGNEKVNIRIYVNDQGSKVMSIGRVQKPNEAATPVSAVQATLFMQDGSVIKPQPFPGTDAMVSVSIGHGPSKETLPFDLKNVNLDQVQEVQIDFRGKTSPRTKLQAP